MNDTGDNRAWRNALRHGWKLAIFATGVALLLALVNAVTSERIAQQGQALERRQLDEVLPPAAHDNDLLAARFTVDPRASDFRQVALLGLGMPRDAYRATLRDTTVGVILPVETPGFNGTIVLRVGIDRDGNITGVRVVQHNETPGLGDRIDARLSPWILGFGNRSLENTPQVLWQVKRDGGDFDQFVGATITPRATIAAIYNALLFFEQNRDRLLQP